MGCHAVYIAIEAQIFHNEDQHPCAMDISRNLVNNAIGNSLQMFLMWKAQMDANMNQQNVGTGIEQNDWAASETVIGYEGNTKGDILPYNSDAPEAAVCLNGDSEIAENVLLPVDPSQLKTDQHQAYNIIIWHLDQTL